MDEITELKARLAYAERCIESAGCCLVMSNNGPREALAILRGYKEGHFSVAPNGALSVDPAKMFVTEEQASKSAARLQSCANADLTLRDGSKIT